MHSRSVLCITGHYNFYYVCMYVRINFGLKPNFGVNFGSKPYLRDNFGFKLGFKPKLKPNALSLYFFLCKLGF